MAEAGVPGYDSTVWYALLAPARTPKEVIQRIHAELMQTLKDPAFKALMATTGTEPIGSTPEELSGYVTQEIAKWSKVVKSAGMKPE
jgi:tripartite-type tricarboxylate transporter receptor subunit TctC